MAHESKLFASAKDGLYKVYLAAINSVKPDKVLADNFNIRNETLVLGEKTKDRVEIDLKSTNVHLIGFGKSSLSMASVLTNRILKAHREQCFQKGFVIAPSSLIRNPIGHSQLDCLAIKCRFGAKNNLPDDDSLKATNEMLQFIKETTKHDADEAKASTYLVLIGGGGSACLTNPRYIDLEKKLHLIRHLQARGADIVELNKVRKFFSHVKGGGLARHMLRSGENVNVISLILSDVIGNPIKYIASGPTYIDDQSKGSIYDDMKMILDKYHYTDIGNKFNIEDETELVSNPPSGMIRNIIIGDNNLAIQAASEEATRLGLNVDLLGNSFQGDTLEILNLITCHVSTQESTKFPSLLIAGGEATIRDSTKCSRWGLGGRAQEMALEYLISGWDLPTTDETMDIFLAGSTDGQDGPTEFSGCLVSRQEWSRLGLYLDETVKSEALEAKASHNSTNFWLKFKPDWLLKTGLTQTNVMDLFMLLRANQNTTNAVE